MRNISWRADLQSKQILHDVGAVKALMEASMNAIKETTMKSFLSALWNISAHSPENKVHTMLNIIIHFYNGLIFNNDDNFRKKYVKLKEQLNF